MPSVQRLLRQVGVFLALTDQCVFGLANSRGELHKKPTGFVTNNRTVAEALSKRCAKGHHHAWIWGSKAVSQRAQVYPPGLVDAILESYSRSIGKAPQEIRRCRAATVITEDQRHNVNYFEAAELQEIEEQLNTELSECEILAGEEVREAEDLLEEMKPEALGVTEDLLDGTGWKQIRATKRWIYVGENEPEIATPPSDGEAWKLPWRSTWSRQNGRWVILEDEIRWQHDLPERLPGPPGPKSGQEDETFSGNGQGHPGEDDSKGSRRPWSPRAQSVHAPIDYQTQFGKALIVSGYGSLEVENDGSEALPSSLETPTQRGLTERAGADTHRSKESLDIHLAFLAVFSPATAVAFHAADCDQALRAAALAGPRKVPDFEVGQAVYFWRRGAGSTKKTRQSYWAGPGRVVMTSMPNAVWIAYTNTLIKASPERVRHASAEENLSVSGWLRGISQTRQDFEKLPKKGFIDLTDDPAGDPETLQEHAGREAEEDGLFDADNDIEIDGNTPEEEQVVEQGLEASGSGLKREAEGAEDPPGKRSRAHLIEVYNLHLQGLAKQRQKKEAKVSDFKGKDFAKLQTAILKEINNNLGTQAYEILSRAESSKIEKQKPEKIMESRYVITKKPLEPAEVSKAESEGVLLEDREHGPCKAKCRHVMKGYSEESALDVEFTTPQITRDSVVFILQMLASFKWMPGFLDFTQAFHSGDKIDRELYCRQPREGIPGAHPEQLLRLLKTCYGLTDGPLAWYRHLAKRLKKPGYETSKADPCVFFLRGSEATGSKLEGIIGVATDDLLHGGNERHWKNIETIAKEYKLGKNQKGFGRFTGKDIAYQSDGSITMNQKFYVEDKVQTIPLDRKRKQQRYSKCSTSEIESLRSSLGVLSWLAKETRCDLAGRVALLQQAFPEPQVKDLIEANRISEEARKFSEIGIKVMPIPVENLRVSVVTDAAWGNSKEQPWIEDHSEDFWEETEESWIRHHVHPRRTTFHPGASPDGPDLVELRVTTKFNEQTDKTVQKEIIEDKWSDANGIRVLQKETWTGTSCFPKSKSGKLPAAKVHSSLTQLQNLSSQGGQIVIYHDKGLSESETPAMTTVAAWKSYRLKRKPLHGSALRRPLRE
ncbi:RE1 [Symbiodinium sp. CCMP2592]|nr:RE1 [Symbiodinium sp. CCMP2592]